MTSNPVFLTSSPVLAMGRALRIFLITATILALATMAFVLGRVSVGSGSVPTSTPAVNTQVPTTNASGTCQQIAHSRSVAC
jgi:hypothetical protein